MLACFSVKWPSGLMPIVEQKADHEGTFTRDRIPNVKSFMLHDLPASTFSSPRNHSATNQIHENGSPDSWRRAINPKPLPLDDGDLGTPARRFAKRRSSPIGLESGMNSK